MAEERNKHRELCGAPYFGFGHCALCNEPNLCSTVLGAMRWTISRNWVLGNARYAINRSSILGMGYVLHCFAVHLTLDLGHFRCVVHCCSCAQMYSMHHTQVWAMGSRNMRCTIPQGVKNVVWDEKCFRGWKMLSQWMKNVKTGDEKCWKWNKRIKTWLYLNYGNGRCVVYRTSV